MCISVDKHVDKSVSARQKEDFGEEKGFGCTLVGEEGN